MRPCAGAVAIVALSLLPCTPARCLPAPNVSASVKLALQRDLQAYLHTRGAAEHVSALSLAVSSRPDQPTIAVTAGTTRYGAGRPLRPSDLFQIGSNTKAFTAVAVLQLEARGRLSIDAPIGEYLSQYPAYAKLTLRQLLSMTGGIESYDNTPAWEHAYASDPMANESADQLIRFVYPKFRSKPGTQYWYSNTGYLLAQEVVAARSESKSFEAEIARIVASVGLKNTYYTSTLYPRPVAQRVVAGYYEMNDPGFEKYIGKDVSGFSLSWAQGAGSMVSTPQDLTQWARALYRGTSLLPAKQKAELMSLVSTTTGQPMADVTASDAAGFGLGVAKRYTPQFGAFWFYQGETIGFRAAHLYFPKSGLVVAVFANSRTIEKESRLPQLFATIAATLKKYHIA